MSVSPRLVLCDRIVDLAFGLVESRSAPGTVLGRLSPSERAALAALASRPGEIVDRASLVEAIGRPLAENALERLISRIRSRIEADPAAPRHLRTARGLGYRLDFSESQAALAPPSSDIVGRREELDQISRAEAKLLVLLGPAGVGKTTLARAWLLGQVGWFVDLAAVHGEREVFKAIAEAMGISGDPLRSIAAKLAPLECAAIVLDNAEQCSEALASALASLRPVAHSARWIVTSRRPLGLPDEHRLTIGALSLQDATTLWMRRAQAVDPLILLDDVLSIRIVSRLARNPLAIELAAAHLDRMSPIELARRLDASSGWLSAPAAGREERQVSLPRAIEWSWDLLDDSDREALLAWSLFCGRFSMADALCLVPDGLPALHRLVDHSLVELLSGPAFQMHAPVREYARRRLAQHERGSAWRDAWRRWCVDRASQQIPSTLAETREWLAAFDEDPGAEGAPQLAIAILNKGAWLPMERRLSLAACADRARGLLRGELLAARAGLRRYAGLPGYREDLSEALEIARQHGGQRLADTLFIERSHLRRADGDIDGAEEDLLALPARPNVRYLLGNLYLASAQPQRAREQMLALLASCPSDLPEFMWRARMSIAVADAITDPQRALESLVELDAELDGESSHAPVVRCFVRGWRVPILWELGRHSEASALAELAVRAMRSFGWVVPYVELSAMAAALAPSIELSRAALDTIEAPGAELKRIVAAWRATIESLSGEPSRALESEREAAPSPPERRSQLAAQLLFNALARQIRAGGDLSLLETSDVLPPGAEVSLLRAFPPIRALCRDLRARAGR